MPNSADRETPRRRGRLPGGSPDAEAGMLRYRFLRWATSAVVRIVLRVRVEGVERLPDGPAVLCFNHMNWADPLVLLAALPWRPRIALFGPKEEHMDDGWRNRFIHWTRVAVPYKPGKNDLLDTTRRVHAVFDAGWLLGIAGEGRIHRGERELLPLNEGAAYFALRGGVPIVPVAINGTSWIGFRREVRVRVGEPIPVAGRPSREAIADVTERTWRALHGLIAEYPDPSPPGPVGRWMTDWFNDWPEGARPALPSDAPPPVVPAMEPDGN